MEKGHCHLSNQLKMLGLAVTAVFLGGCSFILKTNVSDLKLLSVSLQKADDVPHGQAGWSSQPDRKVLVAAFQTAYDFDSKRKAYDYFGITANVTACGTGAKLWPASIYEMMASAQERGRGHFYEIWFDYKWLNSFGPDYVSYDLRKNPEDLCVEISGNPYLGLGVGLTSNTMIVPKQAIIDALR